MFIVWDERRKWIQLICITKDEGKKRMREKKILALALSVALATSPAMYVMAEDEPIQNSADTENTEDSEEIIADKTDENVQIEGQQDSGDDVSAQSSEQGNTERMVTGGYIPSELDYNTPVYNSEGDAARAAVNLPTVYPTNMEWFKSTYPQVRDQNPYGTCWAFSSMGLAEFDLINDSLYDGTGKYNSTIDLSELQLAYYTYNFVQDPLGGTEGDYAKYYKENATVDYLNYGGNYEMASRRLGQWISAVDEAVVPYGNASAVLSNGMDDSYAYNNVNTHLENTYCINIKQNVSDVKQQIMEHGAVGIMYQHAYSGMNYINNTYYDTDISGGGHAVMIVGWDDTFSKDKFGGTAKPSTDGAWLVRNSWGAENYNFDYFWMSYETASLADTAWVFDFSADDGYDNNYQLDGGISTWSSGYKTVANVYNVSKKEGVSSETLKAVSLSFMHTSEVNYTIEIYTDLKNSNNPATGTKQEVATTTGTTTYAGVYNVPLNSEVELAPGSSFAVVVKTDKASIDYEQSTGIVNENNQMIWDCSVSQANQKSFYGNDYNNFWAWPWGNYCIKAFTSNNIVKNYSIIYELDGGTNNSENPITYTPENNTIILKNPTKEGYIFEGWYLERNYINKITQIPENASRDYILYAKWTEVNNSDLIAENNKETIQDGTYMIQSGVNLRRVMDVRGGSKVDGAKVQIYEENGTDAQKWKITHDEKGYVIFENINSGKVLELEVSEISNRMILQQGERQNTQEQKWIAIKNGDGSLKLVSAKDTNMCIDLKDENVTNGNSIQIYKNNGSKAQRWYFEDITSNDYIAKKNKTAIEDGTYIIQSVISQKSAMDVRGGAKADGAKVQIYEENGTDAQKWKITHDEKGYVIFENINSGKVLELESSEISNRMTLQQGKRRNTQEQKWIAIKNRDGSLKLVSAKDTNMCIDLKDENVVNGNTIQIYKKSGSRAQRWFLKK